MALGRLLLLGLLVLGSAAFAAEKSASQSTVSGVSVDAAAVVSKPYGLLIVTSFDTNRAPVGDSENDMSMGLELWPTYKFTDDTKLTGFISVSQALTGERAFLTSDSLLSLQVASVPLTQGLKFKPFVRLSLPTSHASLFDTGLIAGLRAAAQLAYEVGDVSGFLELSAGRNLHTSTTAISGGSNNVHAAGGRFLVAWSLSDKLSLTGDFRLNSGWTYQTGAPRTTFLFAQEIAYQVNDALGVALSHSNDGDIMKPNGIDTNVAIGSDQSSKFSLSANYQL